MSGPIDESSILSLLLSSIQTFGSRPWSDPHLPPPSPILLSLLYNYLEQPQPIKFISKELEQELKRYVDHSNQSHYHQRHPHSSENSSKRRILEYENLPISHSISPPYNNRDNSATKDQKSRKKQRQSVEIPRESAIHQEINEINSHVNSVNLTSSSLQSPFHPDTLKPSAKKDCANKVLASILTPPFNTTVNQYKTYLIEWKKYCDANFQGDCSISAARMLTFFQKVVFVRKVKKYVDPMRESHRQDSVKTKCKWKPVDIPVDMNSSNWQDVRTLVQGFTQAVIQPSPHSRSPPLSFEHQNVKSEGEDASFVENPDIRDDKSYSLQVNAKSDKMAEDFDRDKEYEAHATALTNPIDTNLTDKYGRKIIEVPVGPETIDCAMKALVFLWRQQSSDNIEYPNTSPNPRRDAHLAEAIDGYKTSFIIAKSAQDEANIEQYPIRETYSEQQFISMILSTWCMLPLNRHTGTRSYNVSNRFPYIREHLSILARHHMLLRDEDIRNLNLSDIFSVLTPRRSDRAMGVVFRLSPSKSGQESATTYALAYRHKNFIHCTVSALAFYMLERFEVEKEALPEFWDRNHWSEIKLLRAFGNSKEKQANRKVVLSSTTQIDSTRSIMRSCGVYNPMTTHSGRQAGILEGEYLGIQNEDMCLLGRQSQCTSEAYQLPQLPITGALGMAHFKDDEEVFLERNLVIPPLELQRLIFPWIETIFNKDLPQRTESWIKECEMEMKGKGTKLARDEYLHKTPEEVQGMTYRGIDDPMEDSIGFLQLLVRLRQIILQDAALYLKPDSEGKVLSNDLIRSLPYIFETTSFSEYQSELLTAIENHHKSNKPSYSARIMSAIKASPSQSSSSIDPSTSSIDPLTSSIDPSTSSIDPSTSSIDPSNSSIDPSTITSEETMYKAIQSIVKDMHEIKYYLKYRFEEQDSRIDSLLSSFERIHRAFEPEERDSSNSYNHNIQHSLPSQIHSAQRRQSFPDNYQSFPEFADLCLQNEGTNSGMQPYSQHQHRSSYYHSSSSQDNYQSNRQSADRLHNNSSRSHSSQNQLQTHLPRLPPQHRYQQDHSSYNPSYDS